MYLHLNFKNMIIIKQKQLHGHFSVIPYQGLGPGDGGGGEGVGL